MHRHAEGAVVFACCVAVAASSGIHWLGAVPIMLGGLFFWMFLWLLDPERR